MKIRCSNLPLNCKCGQSITPPEISIDNDSLPARLGSGTHDGLYEVVSLGLDSPPDLSPIMHRWALKDRGELEWLIWTGIHRWKDLHKQMRLLKAESSWQHKFGKHYLTGHPDIICETPDGVLVVIDFKSGRVDKDYNDQLMGYAWLVWKAHPSYKSVKVITIWLRDNETDIEDISRADMTAWEARLKERLDSKDYNPDTHCFTEYCPRRYECPAVIQKCQAVAEWVRAIAYNEDIGPPGSCEDLALQYPDTRMMKGVIKEYESMFKDLLQGDGGTYPDGKGKGCSYKEGSEDKLVPEMAIDLVSEYMDFPDDRFESVKAHPEVFSLSLSKFLDVMTADMERGKKKEKDQITEDLRKGGALKVITKRNISHKKL